MVLAVACGGSKDVAEETRNTEPLETPTSPVTFDSQGVCDLVSESQVAEILDSEVTNVEAPALETPQCSYSFTAGDGSSTNVTTTVQRPADLEGNIGQDGFDFAVSLLGGGEAVDGVGDQAELITFDNDLIELVVLVEGQVLTLTAFAPITGDQLGELATAMAANL